jgi:triosephosphate isomerase
VAKRLQAALAGGLTPIVCIGETLEERDAGTTNAVVKRQVEKALAGLTPEQAKNLVLAYEPVWALGTGRTATPEQAQEVHAYLRGLLGELFGAAAAEEIRILYGGSMKPNNAAELLRQSDIDGGLIGGAALKAADFLDIVTSA